MDRMIYTSMSGAKATMQRQDTLANNLANVSTVGFRAELQAFRSVPVQGNGASTRAFALETTPGYDDSHGPVNVTDQPLDVAMKGNAWLAVQGTDGTEGYTRAGALDVAADGTIMTLNGLAVMGDGGPIQAPPNVKLSIGTDGTVSAMGTNGKSSSIGRLKLVTPTASQQLVRGTDGLFRATDGDLPADATAQLQSGALESSNVSAVETMVSMISAARQFEAQMKLLTTAEGNDKSASQMLAVN